MTTIVPHPSAKSATHAGNAQPDGQHRVVMAMTLMRSLQGVMQIEGELLRNLPLDSLHEIQAEKIALVGRHELALRQLRGTLSAPTGMGEGERAVLDAGVRELAAAVRRNVDCLTRARALLDEIAQAIDESLAMMRDGSGLAPRPRLASA